MQRKRLLALISYTDLIFTSNEVNTTRKDQFELIRDLTYFSQVSFTEGEEDNE